MQANQAASVSRTGRWFLRPPSDDCMARLFCLPYSGCGASMYRGWPRRLPGGIEVCAIQLPGRENRLREPSFSSYEELADALAPVLEPYLDRPYGLFGHCSSALSAYETALRLIERNAPQPACLFASAEVAPHEGPYGRYFGMSAEELADEMRALVTAMGGVPVPGLIRMSVDILRADVAVNGRYRKAEPVRLPCPLVAIGWSEARDVTPAQMNGWKDCGQTTFTVLSGGQYEFLAAPKDLVEVLAAPLLAAVGTL